MAAYTYGPVKLPIGQPGYFTAIGASGSVFFGNIPVAFDAAGLLHPVADTLGLIFVGYSTLIPPGPNSVTGDGVTSNISWTPICGGVVGTNFDTITYSGTAPTGGAKVYWVDTATVSMATTNSVFAGIVQSVNTANSTVSIRLLGNQ